MESSPGEAGWDDRQGLVVLNPDSAWPSRHWPLDRWIGLANALGPHSRCFDSGDLDCGYCMKPRCARGDLLCLTRLSVEEVSAKALETRLLRSASSR